MRVGDLVVKHEYFTFEPYCLAIVVDIIPVPVGCFIGYQKEYPSDKIKVLVQGKNSIEVSEKAFWTAL